MENKKYRLLRISNLSLIILVSFFCWMLLRTIFPHYPASLPGSYNLCDISSPLSWGSSQMLSFRNVISRSGDSLVEVIPQIKLRNMIFTCNAKIPLMTLFSAKTIFVEIYSSQDARMAVFLQRNGSGGMIPEYQKVPSHPLGYFNTTVYQLDQKSKQKINYLIGDYNEVVFVIDDFDSPDNMVVYIKNIYLK